jgi:hypothetical protein
MRQFANFGPGDPGGFALAQALSRIGYEPKRESVRETLETVQASHTGRGRKGFEATLDDSDRFNLRPYASDS